MGTTSVAGQAVLADDSKWTKCDWENYLLGEWRSPRAKELDRLGGERRHGSRLPFTVDVDFDVCNNVTC